MAEFIELPARCISIISRNKRNLEQKLNFKREKAEEMCVMITHYEEWFLQKQIYNELQRTAISDSVSSVFENFQNLWPRLFVRKLTKPSVKCPHSLFSFRLIFQDFCGRNN